jgi:ribosomal protein S18 acetylase RimI-like enzyme
MTPALRPAEPRDVDGMVRLLEVLFAIEADLRFDAAKQVAGLRLLLESPKDCILVAELEGRVVGMVSVQTVISTAEGGPVGWIEDLVVAEAARGCGIGRRLLEEAEAWAFRHGLARLQLLADRNNEPALEFYHRLGWAETSLIALRRFPAKAG